MVRVRPAQVWERRSSPGSTPVIVREVGAGKVTYQSMTPGRRSSDVVTVQSQTFKRIYKRKKQS